MKPFLLTVSCVLATTLPAQGPSPEVTFTEHIAPILFNNCTGCHRPGEIAPFPLMSYRDARRRGRMIQEVTARRYMPPWHPVEGFGEFRDSRALSGAQIDLIDRWVKAGMPQGDPAKTPELPEFTPGWQLGEPDLVVTMPDGFEVPEAGPDIYRNFFVSLDLDEDQWVTAVELRASAPTVLHHTLFYLDDTGNARAADGRDGRPGFRGMGFQRSGSLGVWAVGSMPRHLPMNLAMPLSKDEDLVLASHFHPSGKPETEKTTIGLHFADRPPTRTLVNFMVPPVYGARWGIDIPAGAAEYVVRDSFTLPAAIELVKIGGHAHYICGTMKAMARLPDGTQVPLFYIDDWDFNWQNGYEYQEPVPLPEGTVIEVALVYDNSTANPRNPYHPPERIRWGLDSTDEMGTIFFTAVPESEADVELLEDTIRQAGSRATARRTNRLLRRAAEALLAADRNGDGFIEPSELPARFRAYLHRFDTNADGRIDPRELAARGGDDRR